MFKYFNFFTGAVVDFLNMFAIHLHPMTLKLLLPVGISFYTFQQRNYKARTEFLGICDVHIIFSAVSGRAD